jgi:hypothetical protein
LPVTATGATSLSPSLHLNNVLAHHTLLRISFQFANSPLTTIVLLNLTPPVAL